jgi:hypothetical protein
MSKPKNRREQIEQRSREFAKSHPDVGPLFDRFALELIARGFRHHSASAVWNRIRWETPAGDDGLVAFKLNNDYCPHFARQFMKKHPHAAGFFRTRRLKSEDAPPSKEHILGPADCTGDE